MKSVPQVCDGRPAQRAAPGRPALPSRSAAAEGDGLANASSAADTLMLPRWSHLENLLALLIVFLLCFLVGVAMRTVGGRLFRARIEDSILVKIPGYILLRSLTRQLAGESRENVWKPALAEIEDALVPAFIIEEFDDGRYTIFVPSSPSPFTGAVYILGRERVHLLDASLAQTVQAVSRWGSGSRDLVAAMKPSTR